MAETIPGGRYRVRGKLVDANGKPVKDGAKLAESKASDSGQGSLDGVDFASEAAREAAQDAGLSAGDFKGASPSSPNGYTKPDVQAIVEASGT
jgi:hypothetical protein